MERQFNQCSQSLQWNKDRVRELEMKLKSVQEVEHGALSRNVIIGLILWGIVLD